MAIPLTPEGAIPTMEDAVRLLRRAPLATWVCHWAGSMPFALLAMWCWNDLTNPRTLDSTGALESLALTLMLLWMNCWRSIFAGRLRRQLSDAASNPPWTTRRVWRLAAIQSFFGATKLVILPLAVLSVFPLASAVAFYRNLAVLADRDDLAPWQLIARARKLAGLHPRQNWALLSPLILLYLIVAVNLGIVLAVLPQLVRMLTGYESAFSRSGTYFALNPLFFLFVFAVSWIAFDPFVQAVYCVLCFRGESLETGEDLRAALGRLRSAAGAAAAALLLALLLPHASAAVPPPELEKSVQKTMQSHEYDWRLPPPPGSASPSSWVVRMADHVVAGMKAVARAVAGVLARIYRWLKGDPAAMPPSGDAPPAAGLHWSLYVAMAIVLLASLVVLWRHRHSRTATLARGADLAPTVRLDADDLTPDRLPEERWLELAGECQNAQNFRLALRALYLANLAWLGRCGFLTIDAGKTNREYELELKRRLRSLPDARALFTRNIAAFECSWYGLHPVTLDDIQEFRGRVSRMKTILPESREAAA